MGCTRWGLQLFSLRSRILSGEEPACALPETVFLPDITLSSRIVKTIYIIYTFKCPVTNAVISIS